MPPKYLTFIVVLVACVIAGALGIATWDIHFWPSDARVYYYEAALRLNDLHFLSEIHTALDQEKVRWLHGKEIFILAVHFFQKWMHDDQTLRPFMALNILSTLVSSLLIFFISRKLWGRWIALFLFFIFSGSVWIYVYILFAKHIPLGLVFFLGAVACLILGKRMHRRYFRLFFSGLLMGLAVFSSNPSPLYFPFWLAACVVGVGQPFFIKDRSPARKAADAALMGAVALAGVLAVLVYVNAPDLVGNIRRYIEYIRISGHFSHFYYNQPFLQQWFPDQDVSFVRGGWEWVVKYLFVILPVVFPAAVLCLVWILISAFQQKDPAQRRRMAGVAVLSISPAVMAEAAGVSQYGANYFPLFIGIMVLLAEGMHHFWKSATEGGLPRAVRRVCVVGAVLLLTVHVGFNLYIFLTDVYPTRMAATRLARVIRELKPDPLYTYEEHPHRNHIVLSLGPEVLETTKFVSVESIVQPKEGVILVPPMTGDSIYIPATSSYGIFSADPFLNKLVERGRIREYAIASFPTVANSRIWLHEEEILSYRKLILGHPIHEDDLLGRVWLLDAARFYHDRNQFVPSPEGFFLLREEIKNIGRKDRRNVYEGFMGEFTEPKTLTRVMVPLYKIGDPEDSLRAFVYRVDPRQNLWVPVGPHFRSEPLPAATLGTDPVHGQAVFTFDPPLELDKGDHFFIVYRTGKPDNNNFYRIKKGVMFFQ